MHVSKPAAVMLVPAFIVTLVAAATNQLSQLAFNAGNELPGTHGGDFSHNKLITAEVACELDDLRNAWQIRGVQVAAVKLVDSEDESKGWITETAAFGEADREGRKMTDRDLVGIASNSKLFTAISAGLLINNDTIRIDGEPLSWNTKVKAILRDDWMLQDKVAEEQTNLIDLLSHRTGLPRHDMSYSTDFTARDVIRNLRYLKTSAEFRERWQYNNMAYATASSFTEVLAGVPFTDYVKSNIWDRLGMKDTYVKIDDARATGRLVGGVRRTGIDVPKCFETLERDGDWQGKKDNKLPESCYGKVVDIGWFTSNDQMNAGAGGVISCAQDMATWLKTLLLEGRHPVTNASIIPSDVIQAAATSYTVAGWSQQTKDFSTLTYGMGQMLHSYRGHAMVEHGGSVPGHMTQVLRFPHDKVGIFVSAVDSEFGSEYHKAARIIIADHIFGLERTGTPLSEIQSTAKGLGGLLRGHPERPNKPTPPSSKWTDLMGSYHDKGYGDLFLCPVEKTFEKVGGISMSTSMARKCAEHQDEIPFTFTADDAPTFVARVPKLWANHLALSHVNGNVFKVETGTYWPETGSKTGPQIYDGMEGYFAQFGDGGVGFEGNYFGAGGGAKNGNMTRDGVEKGAEVFYKKI